MLYLMLRREGWRANHKRVERLYREMYMLTMLHWRTSAFRPHKEDKVPC